MLGSWFADVRYAVRRLSARPGYAVLAIATLALGVGGTAAIYGIARILFFDPLPYANERELGVFWKKTDWTEEEFLFVRGRVPGFRDVALFRARDVILRQGEAPARLISGIAASSELFDVLGARPLLGQGFRPGDDAAGAEPVAVLSHGLWQEVGGDPDIIGTRLTLDGRPRTVIGVMPRGFWFPDPAVRLWMAEPLEAESRSWNSTLIGRVEAGQDPASLGAALSQLTAMLGARFDYPAQWDKTRGAAITPVREDLVGGMRPAVLATLGAMALILLIACANVGALMLGQVDARSTELAVRLALGARRRRITQQFVVEAMLLAVLGGALGAALASGGLGVLARALPLGTWAETARPDWTVFAAAMLVALAAALLIVLAPTASLWRSDLRGPLAAMRTGGIRGRGGRLEGVLVVTEVALAVLITTGTALLARSVGKLYSVDPGVRIEDIAVVDVMMGSGRDGIARAVQEMRRTLLELPGVTAAGATQTLPLRSGGYNLPIRMEGAPDSPVMTTEYRIVTPGYLESMGIELRSGRTITDADTREAEPVVVINEALADHYFPGVDPVGRRIGGDIGNRFARVVGVVGNAAERQLTGRAEPVRYVALAQTWSDERYSLVLRAQPGADMAVLLDAARSALERVVPDVAVQGTTTMRRVLDEAVGPVLQVRTLLSLLTSLALVLGAIGVYGVIAHFAARRKRDWAIRLALGLPVSRVITRIVGHGVLLAAAGIAIGAVAAAALARLIASFLYGVSTLDPLSFSTAAAALLAISVLAALGPALRASRTDPAIVLREP